MTKEKFLQFLKNKQVDDDMIEDLLNYFNERSEVKLNVQEFMNQFIPLIQSGRITIDEYIKDKLIDLEINQLIAKEGIIYL